MPELPRMGLEFREYRHSRLESAYTVILLNGMLVGPPTIRAPEHRILI
jgi:hypothetical protein